MIINIKGECFSSTTITTLESSYENTIINFIDDAEVTLHNASPREVAKEINKQIKEFENE